MTEQEPINVQGGLATKTNNRIVSNKHRIGRILALNK